MLAAAVNGAGTAQFEVNLSETEAVLGFFEGFKAFEGAGRLGLCGQKAMAGMGAAADAAPQLVQGGQAEAFGAVDQHDGGVGYVDANFDDAGGHQNIDVSGRKLIHDSLLFGGAEAAMQQA